MNNNLDIVVSGDTELIQKAYEYCCFNFSHNEIIEELKKDDEIKKQLCIINLKSVNNQKEADLLVSNLINKGGPIREVTSMKINELINKEEYVQFFQTTGTIDIFIKAINDVNPNVSRNIVEFINLIENKNYLKSQIYKKIFTLFDELEDLNKFKKLKSHVINKKSFNLYWSLETIIQILPGLDLDENLEEILLKASEYEEYPIREKAAKILSGLNKKTNTIIKLIETLKEDCNMYVRRYL